MTVTDDYATPFDPDRTLGVTNPKQLARNGALVEPRNTRRTGDAR